jgi:hypothetical protein
MRRALAALLAFTIGLEPPLLLAQQAGVGAASSPPQTAATGPPAPSLEVMGLSFERIKRELGDRAPSPNATPLKLEYYVEVTALAPTFQLFTPQELAAGPVPGAPPTHWEMVAHVTKPEFRSPSVPISSLAFLVVAKLVQREVDRQKRQKAEAALRLRNEELRRQFPDLIVQDKK